MLAADGAVDDWGPGALRDPARRADLNRAVDDRQPRPNQIDVARSFSHEILNLEWKAEMQHIGPARIFRGRREVYTDDLMTFGKKLQERLAHFSQPDHNDLLNLIHQALTRPSATLSRRERARSRTFSTI